MRVRVSFAMVIMSTIYGYCRMVNRQAPAVKHTRLALLPFTWGCEYTHSGNERSTSRMPVPARGRRRSSVPTPVDGFGALLGEINGLGRLRNIRNGVATGLDVTPTRRLFTSNVCFHTERLLSLLNMLLVCLPLLSRAPLPHDGRLLRLGECPDAPRPGRNGPSSGRIIR
jgi:hypothetical protein